jgi:hypothetical protein
MDCHHGREGAGAPDPDPDPNPANFTFTSNPPCPCPGCGHKFSVALHQPCTHGVLQCGVCNVDDLEPLTAVCQAPISKSKDKRHELMPLVGRVGGRLHCTATAAPGKKRVFPPELVAAPCVNNIIE